MKHTIILRITALAMAASLTPTYADGDLSKDYYEEEEIKLYIKAINEYLKELRPELEKIDRKIEGITELTDDNIPELKENINILLPASGRLYTNNYNNSITWRIREEAKKEIDARERAIKEKEDREARALLELKALERKKAEEEKKAKKNKGLSKLFDAAKRWFKQKK